MRSEEKPMTDDDNPADFEELIRKVGARAMDRVARELEAGKKSDEEEDT